MPLSDSFEQQFQKKVIFHSPMGDMETLDIIPSKMGEQTPILLVPGWKETLKLQKVCLEELYKSGRRVLALDYPRVRPEYKNSKPYPFIQRYKAEALLDFLRWKKVSHVDVLAHSEGAINFAIAAEAKPEYFRHVVLVAPAGLQGRDNPWRIMWGFLNHVRQTHTTDKLWHLFRAQTKRMTHSAHTLSRLKFFVSEMSDMASFDIHPLLLTLRKKGISIAILAGETDSAFPLQTMKQHLAKQITPEWTKEEKENFGFTLFATKPGGHELYVNNHEIMKKVFELFNVLEKPRSH